MVDDINDHHAEVGDVDTFMAEAFVSCRAGGDEGLGGGDVFDVGSYNLSELYYFLHYIVQEIFEGAVPPVGFEIVGGEDGFHLFSHVEGFWSGHEVFIHGL